MERKKIIGRSMSSFNLCQNDSRTNGSVFQARKLAFCVVAQHSVHPTGGSRRVFRQFAWLKVGSAKMALSPPAHPRVTQAVSPFSPITSEINTQ